MGFCDNEIPLHGGWVNPLRMGLLILYFLADI